MNLDKFVLGIVLLIAACIAVGLVRSWSVSLFFYIVPAGIGGVGLFHLVHGLLAED